MNRSSERRGQAGFTLIELVIVIVILGILAAFALPRFAEMQVYARIAKLNGVLGSVKGAAALAHALQLTQSLAPNTSVTMEGQTVTMANGYPTADSAGIMASISMSTAALQAAEGLAVTIPAAGQLRVEIVGAPTQASCSFLYTQPAANNNPPTYGTPVTTGC